MASRQGTMRIMSEPVDLELKARQSKIGKSNVSRAKSHERRVRDLLKAWSGVEFRRRRNEGRDVQTISIESTADVIPVNADFKFSIEAKCGAKFSLDALMASPRTALFTEWWFQSFYDAQLLTAHRQRLYLPMLFFKPHPNHDWIAVSTQVVNLIGPLKFQHLLFDAYTRINPVAGNVSHSKKNKKMVDLCLDDVIICRWKDFAEHVNPDLLFYGK